MSYTQYGPWADGSPPGVAAEFLNPLESFLLSLNSAAYDANISASSGVIATKGLNISPSPVTINGGASGTATLYQDCTGSIKRVMIWLSSFKTGASAQTLALPVPFTKAAFIRTGFIDKCSLLLGGSAQTVDISTAFSASSLGNTTPETVIFGYAFAELRSGSGFDTVSFPGSSTATVTALIEITGV